MLEHRGGLDQQMVGRWGRQREPQVVGRWDRKREKLFRKKYFHRLVKVADREKKKSSFYYKKKISSTDQLEDTM